MISEMFVFLFYFFFFSSRRRHTRCSRDWSSDVCSSDLEGDQRRRTRHPDLHGARGGLHAAHRGRWGREHHVRGGEGADPGDRHQACARRPPAAHHSAITVRGHGDRPVRRARGTRDRSAHRDRGRRDPDGRQRGNAVHPEPETVLAHRPHLRRHPDKRGAPGGHLARAPRRGGGSGGVAAVRVTRAATGASGSTSADSRMARPWLEHYDAGVPATLAPYPEKTLVDVVKETAAERPRHTAAIFKGARLSYGELNGLSDAFAAWLAARGVAKGDRVALIMPNCPQVIIAQLGVWKAGAGAVPLNPLSSEEELAHALAGTGARAAVVLSRFYHKIKHLQPGTALEVVIATNIKEFLPRLLRLAYTLLKERKEGDRVALAPGDVWFQAVIRASPAAAPPRAGPSPSDAALLMLTGGTTGVPKAALLRHRGVLMAASP